MKIEDHKLLVGFCKLRKRVWRPSTWVTGAAF